MNNKELHNLSDIIWKKIKGKPVPETWSNKDREEIIVSYWHRAMESEMYD